MHCSKIVVLQKQKESLSLNIIDTDLDLKPNPYQIAVLLSGNNGLHDKLVASRYFT